MSKKKTILIDADVLCHTFAYLNTETLSFDGGTSLEVLNPDKARIGVESYIVQMLDRLNASDAVVALTDRNANFRKELDPTYKQGRKEKPKLWYELRDYLESEEIGYQKIIYPRLEGDDVLGLLATNEFKGRSIIVSIDKDMQTIPGLLFNPQKDEHVRSISEIAAIRFHAFQTLTGDTTDGYPGLPRCGPVTANAVLEGKDTPESVWEAVVKQYVLKGKTKEDALLQARLAFILRDNHYNHQTNRIRLWNFPS